VLEGLCIAALYAVGLGLARLVGVIL